MLSTRALFPFVVLVTLILFHLTEETYATRKQIYKCVSNKELSSMPFNPWHVPVFEKRYDIKKRVVAYRNSDKMFCFIQKTWGKSSYSSKPLLKSMCLTDSQLVNFAGEEIFNFCKGYKPLLVGTPEAEEDTNNTVDPDELLENVIKYDTMRVKRNTDGIPNIQYNTPLRGRYRGQTQSQYLNFNNGDSVPPGRAEAESTPTGSRAVVSGKSGMGQAQSQSGFSSGCEDCYGQSSYGVGGKIRTPYDQGKVGGSGFYPETEVITPRVEKLPSKFQTGIDYKGQDDRTKPFTGYPPATGTQTSGIQPGEKDIRGQNTVGQYPTQEARPDKYPQQSGSHITPGYVDHSKYYPSSKHVGSTEGSDQIPHTTYEGDAGRIPYDRTQGYLPGDPNSYREGTGGYQPDKTTQEWRPLYPGSGTTQQAGGLPSEYSNLRGYQERPRQSGQFSNKTPTQNGQMPGGGYAPSQAGQAPGGGYAPSQTGQAPSGGYAPSHTGQPPSGGYAPSQTGQAPSGGYAPSHTGQPPSGGYAPSQTGQAPSGGYAPLQTGQAPSGGYAPSQAGQAPGGGYAPSQTGQAPTGGYADRDNGNIYRGQGTPVGVGQGAQPGREDYIHLRPEGTYQGAHQGGLINKFPDTFEGVGTYPGVAGTKIHQGGTPGKQITLSQNVPTFYQQPGTYQETPGVYQGAPTVQHAVPGSYGGTSGIEGIPGRYQGPQPGVYQEHTPQSTLGGRDGQISTGTRLPGTYQRGVHEGGQVGRPGEGPPLTSHGGIGGQYELHHAVPETFQQAPNQISEGTYYGVPGSYQGAQSPRLHQEEIYSGAPGTHRGLIAGSQQKGQETIQPAPGIYRRIPGSYQLVAAPQGPPASYPGTTLTQPGRGIQETYQGVPGTILSKPGDFQEKPSTIQGPDYGGTYLDTPGIQQTGQQGISGSYSPGIYQEVTRPGTQETIYHKTPGSYPSPSSVYQGKTGMDVDGSQRIGTPGSLQAISETQRGSPGTYPETGAQIHTGIPGSYPGPTRIYQGALGMQQGASSYQDIPGHYLGKTTGAYPGTSGGQPQQGVISRGQSPSAGDSKYYPGMGQFGDEKPGYYTTPTGTYDRRYEPPQGPEMYHKTPGQVQEEIHMEGPYQDNLSGRQDSRGVYPPTGSHVSQQWDDRGPGATQEYSTYKHTDQGGKITSMEGLDEDDDANSQAETTIKRLENGTFASSSSTGVYGGGSAQSQISGTYSGSGSFSAQAQTIEANRGAQSQITAGEKGISSTAQGRGGRGQSQVQMQLGTEMGETIAEAQSTGINHGTNTQVKASSKGGLADAQASGPGSTSSQAQIGFQPQEEERENTSGNDPFYGGGTASAQSGKYDGQSQTQIQGRFKYGISYNGAAQAGSGIKDGVARNRTFMKPLNLFGNNNIRIDRDAITNSPKTNKTENINPPKEILEESESVMYDNVQLAQNNDVGRNQNNVPINIPRTGVNDSPNYEKNQKQSSSVKSDVPDSNYDKGVKYIPNVDDYDDSEEDDYDGEFYQSTEATHQELNQPREVVIQQAGHGQKQHIILGPINKNGIHIVKDSASKDTLKEGMLFQPGEEIPGTQGYTIPIGFRGRVSSVSEGKEAYAYADENGESQAQTITLTPGNGNITYGRPTHKNQQSVKSWHPNNSRRNSKVNGNNLKSSYKMDSPDSSYVTVTKSIAGELNQDKTGLVEDKKFTHTYYTKSSTCGYFTFTCNLVYGSQGRTKICKPKVPTNPDGTPINC